MFHQHRAFILPDMAFNHKSFLFTFPKHRCSFVIEFTHRKASVTDTSQGLTSEIQTGTSVEDNPYKLSFPSIFLKV